MKWLPFLMWLSLPAFLKNAGIHSYPLQKIDTTIVNSAESIPEFPGGPEKFNSYLLKNIKLPKDLASTSQGRIIIHMVVEKDGNVSRVKIDGANSTELQVAIYKLIVNFPKWKPAMQNNKPVRFNYTISIACILFSEE